MDGEGSKANGFCCFCHWQFSFHFAFFVFRFTRSVGPFQTPTEFGFFASAISATHEWQIDSLLELARSFQRCLPSVSNSKWWCLVSREQTNGFYTFVPRYVYTFEDFAWQLALWSSPTELAAASEALCCVGSKLSNIRMSMIDSHSEKNCLSPSHSRTT